MAAPKGPSRLRRSSGAGAEAQLVAEIREHDQAIQLVIAVGPLSQHMESEIDLGAGLLADGRRRCAIGYRGRMCHGQIVLPLTTVTPLTPALSPKARLGELASQRGRIRKRMRLERESRCAR